MSHGHDAGDAPVLNAYGKWCLLLLFIVVALTFAFRYVVFPTNTADVVAESLLSLALLCSFFAGIISLFNKEEEPMTLPGTTLVLLGVFADIIFSLPVFIALWLAVSFLVSGTPPGAYWLS